jgi:hypothetical protein
VKSSEGEAIFSNVPDIFKDIIGLEGTAFCPASYFFSAERALSSLFSFTKILIPLL